MWQQRAKTMRQFLGSTWLARCAMSVAIQAPRHVWRLPHVLPGVGLHQRLQFREQVAEPGALAGRSEDSFVVDDEQRAS